MQRRWCGGTGSLLVPVLLVWGPRGGLCLLRPLTGPCWGWGWGLGWDGCGMVGRARWVGSWAGYQPAGALMGRAVGTVAWGLGGPGAHLAGRGGFLGLGTRG